MPAGTSQESPHNKDREQAIFQILTEVVSRRHRGEMLPDASVIASHPHLMPELGARLASLRNIHRSYLAAQAVDGSKAAAAPVTAAPEIPNSCNTALAAADQRFAIQGYAGIEELSSGGQGNVFKAIQESTGRTVAIKVLPGGPLSGWRRRARFDREAEILARLDHPNIVGIIDRGRTADGSLFFVMNFIDGWSLDEYIHHIQSAPIVDLDRVVRLFLEIAWALDEAHRRGIVHRDLKPSNIRVDRQGRPHILDFGLARWKAGDHAQTRAVTETGQIIGSLPWASPEQVSRDLDSLDQRSDLYSLGVMLYQALTGSFPYCIRGSLSEVVKNILKEPPSPPSHAATSGSGHPALDAVVLKALAKSPQERYGSASDFAADLEKFLAGERTAAARQYVMEKRLRRCGVLLASVVLLTAVLGGIYWLIRPPYVQVEPLATWTNSIGMRMVQIPAGRFQMGSPATEKGREEHERQHWVNLTSFHIAATEVTQGQYAAVMGKSLPKQIWVGNDLPVHNVTWNEAQEFCKELSKKEGKRYELPSEAQWEYACRAGSLGWFGGTQRLEEMGWFEKNSQDRLHPVASKLPNHWGLYDMHGGVREWCRDVYNYHFRGDDLTDPVSQVPELSTLIVHLVRGGGIHSPVEECRSAFRGILGEHRDAKISFSDVGFRVIQVIENGQ